VGRRGETSILVRNPGRCVTSILDCEVDESMCYSLVSAPVLTVTFVTGTGEVVGI
jgi:hypothetical protein